MPHAESAAGDRAVFTAHLSRGEAVEVSKNANLPAGWGLPAELHLAFEFDSFLYFHEVGRACAATQPTAPQEQTQDSLPIARERPTVPPPSASYSISQEIVKQRQLFHN